MYHTFFIHSSVDGHLGCFRVLAILPRVAGNIRVHVSSWIMIFSRYMPRSGIAGSYGSCFQFLKKTSVLYSGYAAKSFQSCPTLCNPIDSSPPSSHVPGILQARALEWVAISFSSVWKWKVKVKSLSSAWLLVTPWTAAHQAPPSMGFSRQKYWSGVPLFSPI